MTVLLVGIAFGAVIGYVVGRHWSTCPICSELDAYDPEESDDPREG